MKISIEKNILQDAVFNAQKAIAVKTTMPILQGIYINARDNELTVIGSDKDLTIETKIAAHIEEEGSMVIDSKIFGDILRKLPNETLTIESMNENTINLTCLKSAVALIHMKGEDYPNLPKINDNNMFRIPQGLIKNMIKGTIFAIAQDESRPILTGVLFEVKDNKLNLVALDGYRVALRSEYINTDENIKAVIPGKTLNEVSKILLDDETPTNITFTPNHILFNLGNTRVISRLLEGEFIKYESIIPKEYNLRLEVNRFDILNAIERASLVGKEGNTNLVKLQIEDNTLIITSNSQLGKSREEVQIKLEGESLRIGFNSKYLIDVFKIMDEENVIMDLSSSISPCVIKNKETDNCSYLLLPVRIMESR
ncbi:DNA polymerase-3 subunit beta [Hathewaya proteolytica DSM 3090]|uniref:Beta sliding clamp n=1 Tax=Hathewaya proteolytica DSM 3090 TaxID=1121331 RepID=A0A1M6MMR1_9CLOT|nr:DNA polymerase III subunit beta [Hathewaya proteolytica]SHJ84778.1 DNA polymerase-3 subunit beta [Hathewaya proteolytica DSM 3090]